MKLNEMKTVQDLHMAFMEWRRNNLCETKGCVSNKNGVCEDIRGTEGCKSWKKVN